MDKPAQRPIEGQEFKVEGVTVVWHADKPRQWSCQVCKYWPVADCEPMLEACGLPDCFINKGYYVDKQPENG
jgi:hypothetical protein